MSKYKLAANGKSKMERFYILTRHIARVLSIREKRNARCIQCFNTHNGCDGCAEVDAFMHDCEELFTIKK